jgi:hypothetical protein
MKGRTGAFFVAVALAGCTNGLLIKETPEGNQSVATLDEAGSVHVAVLSLTPWDDVKSKFRPNLQVDDKDLRNQAIPVTFALLDKYLDALKFQASIAPNTVKSTSTTTTSSATGEDDAFKTETSTVKAPGQLREPTAASFPANAASVPAAAASGISSVNSSLTARAMASFKQEVQALNTEVDYAAKRTGFKPYLVRVQVSVMPRRRHLGYDIYSNLSFFGYKGAFDAATGVAAVRTPTGGTPFVVPLLSSDSIETAQRSQSIEAIRDFGVALDLIKGFGSVGASFDSHRDRQQALQGLDVNSVLTMGRLSDNTVRIRLGAAFDPGGGFAVHPRTNTVSVLVFLPTDSQQVRVVSRTSWTHVLDGIPLERSEQRYAERLQPIEDQWKRTLGVSVVRLMEIDELATEGNYEAFEKQLDDWQKKDCERPKGAVEAGFWLAPSYCKEAGETKGAKEGEPTKAAAEQKGGAQETQIEQTKKKSYIPVLLSPDKKGEKERQYAYLWSHLLSMLPGSRFSTTVVDLPKHSADCPAGPQFLVYSEDDKGMSVTLREGKDLNAELKGAIHWRYLNEPVAPKPADAAAAPAAQKGKKDARVPKGAASAAEPAPGPAPTVTTKPTLGGYAGATFADASVSVDRRTATLAFASGGIEPPPWEADIRLVPVAVELSGCDTSTSIARIPPALVSLSASPVFSNSSWYELRAKVPKKKEDAAKEKPAAALSVGTNELLVNAKKDAWTRISVDLGKSPATAIALVVSGAVFKELAPATNIEARADGSFLIKESGTIDVTFANVSRNRTVELELRSIDKETKKLGAPVSPKLSLVARNDG